MSKAKIIAFYLPQYHPTHDNDRWWGKGFTEWTNVGKAKPLFKGHYQPKVPADLGYYDLRLPEVREAQAELAKEAGIYGFCYYHYWFGNGKEELELPFNEVLRLGKPDFPFMLCWANESWHKKFWDKDGKGSSKEMLIEQTYPGEQDIIDHFYRLLPAFKDPRYIRIDGKPAFMIYKPSDMPDVSQFIDKWNMLAKENGISGIYFIGYSYQDNDRNKLDTLLGHGFDAMCTFAFNSSIEQQESSLKHYYRAIKRRFTHGVRTFDYSSIVDKMTTGIDSDEHVFPVLLSNWDHTPRSGHNGLVLTNSTPEHFKKHLMKSLQNIKNKDRQILFLKSWNEWGEGNYVEPDLRFGKKYISLINDTLNGAD